MQDTISRPGICPSVLSERLHRVPVHMNRRSADLHIPGDRLTPAQWTDVADRYGVHSPHSLPWKILQHASFERLCRMRASSIFMMRDDVEAVFDTSPIHQIMAKIPNSIWRTSHRKTGWNEIVAAWNGLGQFTMDRDHITTTIDYTTGTNPYGYATHAHDTYLDGCLAFHVYYRDRRVMTVGFSFASGYRLLLQQVQLTTATGNRWLYALPCNRLEYILHRLHAAFPRHRILVVDGTDLARRSLDNYRGTLERAHTRWARAQVHYPHQCADIDAHRTVVRQKITHLEQDLPRIAAFYANTGVYTPTRTHHIAGMAHHMVIHTTSPTP